MADKIAPILVWCLMCAPAFADGTGEAKAWLSKSLNDAEKADAVMAALRATGDKDVAPLFEALTRSGDKQKRLSATAALAKISGAEAAPVLLERLWLDQLMVIRAEALAHLLELKAISVDQLKEAVKIPDENVQCIAARSLAQRGLRDLAAPTLHELTLSKDLATSSMVRMCLLGMGDAAQMETLQQVVRDPKTPDSVLALLMQQVAEEKIAAARELAGELARTARNGSVKAIAYKALSDISPQPAAPLRDAIGALNETVLRVHLFNMLTSCQGARKEIEAIAAGGDTLAALARFELARPGRGEAAGKAAGEALAIGHPVVIDFVLDRAGKDIAAIGQGADFYVPPLLDLIRSVEPDTARMQSEHVRAAQAATLLADLGTTKALAGLKEFLTGRHDARARAVLAGLRWSKNRAVCDLVRPLLKSPYHDLSTDAAMTLGRFGDDAATEHLQNILAHAAQEQPPLVTLACWYLLRIHAQARAAAEELAKTVK